MPKVKKLGIDYTSAEITKLFKKALIEKEWTVSHLAELCQKDVGTISKLINNPMKVKFETILNVANKLGIDSIPT